MLTAPMKTALVLAAAIAPVAGLSLSASAAPKYLDLNAETEGSGITAGASITLDNATANWNTSSLGTDAASALATTDDAIFSAGTDGNVAYTLTAGAAVTASSALFEEGNVTIGGAGSLSSAGLITIGTGAGSTARVNINSSTRLAGTGKVVLDGGTLFNTSTTTAGSFIAATKGVEVTANNGTVGVDDGVANGAGTGVVQLYTGTITGTGGTLSAGVGTLIKAGADEFRYQGATTANSTFAKLTVNGGLFRLGSVIVSSAQTTAETGFGAAPSAPTADAITLDGGNIGASYALTLNANRGITIGPAGGGFENNSGSLTVPGLLSGTGTLNVQGRILTASSASYGQSTQSTILSNAGNNASFKGAIAISSSTLTLNESLTATNLTGGTLTVTGGTTVSTATTIGQISIASGKTLTVGSDDTSTSFAGKISGSGSFTKVGTGTLTLNTSNATSTTTANVTTTQLTGEWSNTGGVNINAGTIKFGTAAAGFATSATVTIASGATLDMNNVGDTFGPLAGAGSILKGATGGTLTVGGTASTAFSGTISGGGNFAKAGAGTQTITGTVGHTGATTVTAGTLLLANASGPALTATTGVTITSTLSLGAANQVNDAATVTLNGGTLNTGGNGETLGVATLAVNSILDLGTGASVLAFADSSGATWAGSTLKVYNYTGTPEFGGGVDQLFFGTAAGGLTAAQLAKISFYSDAGATLLAGATTQLSSGEVVLAAVPEPASLAAVAALGLFGIVRRRKA